MKYQVSDGVWVDLPDTIPAVGFDPAPGEDFTNIGILLRGDDSFEIIGTFTLSQFAGKQFSRKRIKKLMMSFGVPRNEAEWQSRDCVRRHSPSDRAALLSGLFFDCVFGGRR